MNSNTKKIIKRIVNVILWIFLALSVVITILSFSAQANSDGVPSFGSKCYLTVESNSMKPTFKKGDILIAFKLSDDEKKDLQVGDVVAYRDDINGDGVKELKSHRIVEVEKNADGEVIKITTQGDNAETNKYKDTPVSVNEVVCKWGGKKINSIGNAISFLRSSKGFLFCIVIPLVLLFIYELYAFLSAVLKLKSKDKKEITAEEEEMIKQKAIEEYLQKQKENEKNNLQ